jgi:NTP pyrophosphatase (non-canonical NTP hydrolase)
VKEIGDVLWYVAAMSEELGVKLEHVAEENSRKLLDRKERGVIKSAGDSR